MLHGMVNDGGLTVPVLDKKVNIPFNMALVPLPPNGDRDIPKRGKIEVSYKDNHLAVPPVQTQAQQEHSLLQEDTREEKLLSISRCS